MALYVTLLILHLLGATIWTGGHLVLAISVLPRALREGRAEIITAYEQSFERLGIPALILQVVSGLWVAYLRVGPPSNWFEPGPLQHVVQIKLALLAGTIALALHARLKLIPRLTDATLRPLATHIVIVTVFAVLFVVAGVFFRVGGIG